MIYPSDFENKIGFKAIRGHLKELCISEMGKEFVDKMCFCTDVDEIRTYLRLIQDFETLMQDGVPFPVRDYNDLREEFHHLAIDGTVISLESMFALKPTLSALSYIFKFFKSEASEKVPYLKALAEGISVDNHIFTEINRLIDDKGEIPDNASAELAEIRRDIRRKQSSIDHRMHKILVEAKNSGWTDSTAEMTIRDGRPVIPVRAADKRELRGFIHDESATGQTVYIEPAEIFETNNEIKELEYAERREINKILLAFTKILRPEIPNLTMAWRLLGLLDFIRAKALLSHEYNCVIPELTDEPMFDWIEARHPLLEQKLKGQGKRITPLDLRLGVTRISPLPAVGRNDKKADVISSEAERNREILNNREHNEGRILVISGPNAGGKSVCLKTIGLIQYMLQCGLAIPVKIDSKCGIFHDMFIDIGDEQSLENDLSTYSSHLINMKELLEHGNERTLFLIDEFGTGTEPQLGGAIAEAILLKMNEKKSFGVVTTHYANLKLLADNHPGIVNGAMLFDTRYLQPLYVMMIGKPGSSFAFEIAKKIGFPNEILDSAAEISGREHLDFDQQLQQLEIEKKEVRKKEYELKVADKLLDEVVTKYKSQLADIEKNRKTLLREASKEAQEIIDRANAKIEKTIREIKEAQAEKVRTKELREELKEMKQNLANEEKNLSKQLKAEEKEEIANADLKVGDMVCINELEVVGELLAITDTDVTIQFGDVRLRTTADKLRKISRSQAKKAQQNPSYLHKSIMNDINEKAQHFNLTLDVRGQRGDEAVDNVAKYIDEANLLSIKEVSILHGKGNGILRKLIREYLSKQQCVQSFNDASLETGGAGITRVTLK